MTVESSQAEAGKHGGPPSDKPWTLLLRGSRVVQSAAESARRWSLRPRRASAK
ncbi:hypothetical protein SCALM49S_02655 [Streptomyces californicus]